MNTPFRPHLLLLLVAGISLFATVSTIAEGAKPTVGPQESASADSDRLKALYSDMPEYAAVVPMAPGMKTPPRLIAGSPPAAPVFLEPGKRITVTMSVAISERGEVAAARVLKSDDARCDPLAVAASSTWKFAPATNGTSPLKCVVQLPIQFVAPPVGSEHLNVAIGALKYDSRGLSLYAPIELRTTDLASIKSARVTVTRAVDDTGVDLKENGSSDSFKPSVGSASGEEMVASKMVMPSINLRVPEKSATRLNSLEGFLELVIPGMDPKATAYISQIPQKLGVPVVSEALAGARVSVTLFDRATFVAAIADPRDPANVHGLLVDSPYASMPGWKPPVSAEKLTEGDIVVAVDDPDGRLVGVEFQTVYGAPVTYAHNGWMHFHKAAGKRFSIYRLPSRIGDDIKLVCWLATDRSTIKQNFQLTNLPLPPHR